MEEKLKTVTMRIKPAIHQKLKIISALQDKSMADVITDFIDSYNLEMPKYKKPKKTVKVKKPAKRISADPLKTKQKILALREQELSFQQIAKSLNAEGWPTLSGRGEYQAGTVSKLTKKWEAESNESTRTPVRA